MLRGKTNIGTLDREITFIKPIIEQGDSGEDRITGWEELAEDATVSARKIENSGTTVVAADRVTLTRQTTWQIRYRDDLTVQMRLVWDTQMYEILNIAEADEGRKRFLNIETSLLDNEFFT